MEFPYRPQIETRSKRDRELVFGRIISYWPVAVGNYRNSENESVFILEVDRIVLYISIR